MKNRYYAVAALATLACLCGCAEERIPSDEADAWEVSQPATTEPAAPADNNSAPAPAGTPAGTSSNEAPADGAVAVVKGSAFQIEGRSNEGTGEVFTRNHYFKAEAPLELKSAATVMETDIEGKNSNGAVPIIGLIVQTADGKRLFENQARPIDGNQLLRDQVDLPPGNYTLVMTYYKDSVGEVRPAVTLRTITFRE